MSNAENRYWRETLPSVESFVTAAEKMRLERIRVICDDDSTPEDVREVFQKTLKDEEFHERAFRQMATP